MNSENSLKQRVLTLMNRLKEEYPAAHCTLNFSNPLELLIATILAAQCTDVRVNIVTADLFKKYRNATEYANANLTEMMEDIKSTGFYQNKAKNIIACCQEIVSRHNGKVPATIEELTALAGVGRKTANVILGNAYNVPGIVVDTHVRRLSQRLGLTANSDPTKIEFDLQPLIPKEEWTMFCHRMVEHGRNICLSRRPKCNDCCLDSLCPKIGVTA